ncbi:MAG: hypothetical protein ABUL48_00960 [Pseudorhodoplanes sp.]
MARFHEPDFIYTRDPVVFWAALVCLFAIAIAILGLTLGHVLVQRGEEMRSFANSYQIVGEQERARPTRTIQIPPS